MISKSESYEVPTTGPGFANLGNAVARMFAVSILFATRFTLSFTLSPTLSLSPSPPSSPSPSLSLSLTFSLYLIYIYIYILYTPIHDKAAPNSQISSLLTGSDATIHYDGAQGANEMQKPCALHRTNTLSHAAVDLL